MSTRDIFIVGHGGYCSANGLFILPDNCDVRFYAPVNATLNQSKVHEMLRDAKVDFSDDERDGKRVIKVDRPVPEMTLKPHKFSYSPDKEAFAIGRAKFKENNISPLLFYLKGAKGIGQIYLSSIVNSVRKHKKCSGDDYLRFHWLCCTSYYSERPLTKRLTPVAPIDPDPFADIEIETIDGSLL